MPEIKYVPIKDLKLLERNPRKITKEQFDMLMKSIDDDEDFFLCRPCLVNIEDDGTKRVYAGNQRIRAAKKLGWKEVPCIVQENLNPDVISKRIIQDNKTFGEFDFDILLSDFDVDMILKCGFSNEEVTGDFGDIEDTEKKPKKEKKAVPTICPACNHEF